MVKKLLSVVIGIVMVGAFAGTVLFLWKKSQKKPVVYQIASPRITDIIRKAVATGAVVPRQEVEIKPQISGIIDEVLVEPGQIVKKGDLTARIRLVPNMVTLNNAQNRLERARIDLEMAQADYDRNEKLVRDGTVAAATFQTYDIALKNAREELKSAQDNLDLIAKGTSSKMTDTTNTLVRSTIGGMVLEVPVEVGHSVIEANTFNAGTTIATVADMTDMIFEGYVDESEVHKLRSGMHLRLTVGAIEDRTIEATLERIAPKGVERNGAIQFEIRAAVTPQPGLFIRANYSANADIELERRDKVLVIDESLLKFRGQKPYVEVEKGPQEYERREIKVGLSDGIQIEVLSGLSEKDKIKGPPVETAPAAATRPTR